VVQADFNDATSLRIGFDVDIPALEKQYEMRLTTLVEWAELNKPHWR
jgi:hypothetical protein